MVLSLCLLLSSVVSGQSTLDNFVNDYSKEHNFNGTVLIHGKGLQYQKSYGLANRQFNIPVQNETRFKIASVTKLFTSVLIMQLYEQGRLDLQKTIDSYLPDYKGEGANKVTIHQLLNHTSGMVNIDTITSAASAIKNGVPVYQKAMTTDDLLSKFCSDTLVTEPGKVFSYNNAEYIILGKIIEKIYGKPFKVVLKENILEPLKMENSAMLQQYDIIDGLADTYFFRDDLNRLVNDLPVYIENWYAAGAMYSTANDLLKFSKALFGLRIIKKETLEMLINPGLDQYGYGVWSYQTEIGNKKYATIKRPGSIMGAQAMLVHHPDENLTVIILCNTATLSLDDFVYEISKIILR